MKTYVITFSREFPSTHKRSGEETGFVEKIMSGNKIHTIRKNYDFWEKRFRKINKGEACLSLRYWSGKPYRSKQVEFLRLTKEDGIGIQKVMLVDHDNHFYIKIERPGQKALHSDCIECDDIEMDIRLVKKLSENDGLDIGDFQDWFKGIRKTVAIIHLTKFRY